MSREPDLTAAETAVLGFIDEAAISDTQKATLRRLVETAGTNPDLLRQALDQVKAVMP